MFGKSQGPCLVAFSHILPPRVVVVLNSFIVYGLLQQLHELVLLELLFLAKDLGSNSDHGSEQGSLFEITPVELSNLIDRWKIEFANEDQLRVTIGQTGTSPSDQGFVNSLYVDVDSGDAETAIAADEYVRIVTRLEGLDCQRLRYGTSNAQTTT